MCRARPDASRASSGVEAQRGSKLGVFLAALLLQHNMRPRSNSRSRKSFERRGDFVVKL